jgi:three-Cys-motif partner protein
VPHASSEFDEIGYWSEIKLDIVRDYASAYSRILASKKLPHVYVDAFAGAGQHISKVTGEFVPGSPSNALSAQPPFREYHFIDLNAAKIENLHRIAGARTDVHIYEGDCNEVLIEQIYLHSNSKVIAERFVCWIRTGLISSGTSYFELANSGL